MSELALAAFAAESGRHLVAVPREARFATFARGFDEQAFRSSLLAREVRFVGRSEPGFPPLLRAIHDPPPGLFVRGSEDVALLSRAAVAIVGARSCSPYGAGVARTLGRELASAGLVVVSGLASGIDGEAHRGGLEAAGATVAVLGCGVDRVYPAVHRELARRVLDTGLVVSEYAPGVEPAPWRFPAGTGLSHVYSWRTVMGKALIPVDGYVRVSRKGGRDGDSFLSPGLQRESIKRVAAREGLRVVKWHEEIDASGGDSKRPKWNEAIERVEQGKTRGLVCWNLSRFSRSTADALRAIERVEQAGGRLYSEEGQLDKLSRTIRFAIAEDERDRASAGFRAAVTNAISRGVYIAAKIPFGYLRDPETRRLVPDPERASIVVALFEQRAAGRSWRQLSLWVRETHGLYLGKATLSWMLSNPAYLGHARQGDIVNVRAHEPIVSQLIWDRAQAAKGERPIHTGSTSSGIMLRSLVRCSTCNHRLLVGNTRTGKDETGKRRRVPVYQCRYEHCDDKAGIRADRLDEYVVALVLDFLSKGKVRTGGTNEAELVQAERDHEEASHALSVFKSNRKAITTLGVEAWNELLEEYVVAEAVARETVESLRAEDSIEQWLKVPDLWNEWTDESRREFLGKVVREVVLVPAHRRPVPVEERASVRLHGADVEDRWLLTLAGPREARVAQIDAALADHER